MSETKTLTFEEDDKLNLGAFKDQLEHFLLIEHGFVEGSLVVSLNGSFGSGKTTFLNMWQSDLEKRRETEQSLPLPITLNAWESDYCGDPLLAVVTGLIEVVCNNKSDSSDTLIESLRDAAKDVAWFTTGLASNLVSHWTGIDPVSAGELAKTKKGDREVEPPDYLTLYTQRTKSLKHLKDTLNKIFGGDSPKAFIFVDELDRCRPDYAISYLETIKHIFDVHGLVFVLAVDNEQLASSARALFGQDLNFEEYYRKFVQRTLTLPKPDNSSLSSLAEKYTLKYLEKEAKRRSFMEIDHYRVENIVELISALSLTPRQIQETFRIIGHVLSIDEGKEGKIYWCIGVGVIFMSSLKVGRPTMYQSIGAAQASYLEVGQFLILILGSFEAKWWLSLYLTGTSFDDVDYGYNIKKLFEDLGLIQEGSKFDAKEELKQFNRGWGHSRERLERIYKLIESVGRF